MARRKHGTPTERGWVSSTSTFRWRRRAVVLATRRARTVVVPCSNRDRDLQVAVTARAPVIFPGALKKLRDCSKSLKG